MPMGKLFHDEQGVRCCGFVWFRRVSQGFSDSQLSMECTNCKSSFLMSFWDIPYACPVCGMSEERLSEFDLNWFGNWGARVVHYLLMLLGWKVDEILVDYRQESCNTFVSGAELYTPTEDLERVARFNVDVSLARSAVQRWRQEALDLGCALPKDWKKLDDLPGLEKIFQEEGDRYGFVLHDQNHLPRVDFLEKEEESEHECRSYLPRVW